jgi:UrcA family protein
MRILLASLALASVGVSNAATAQSINEPIVATVSYADLNLDSAAGRAALEGRVKVAANRVCQDLAVTPIADVIAVADCKTALMSSAQRQLGVIALRAPQRTLLASR